MKYVKQRIAKFNDELLVIAASIGTKKGLELGFQRGVRDVMSQVSPNSRLPLHNGQPTETPGYR